MTHAMWRFSIMGDEDFLDAENPHPGKVREAGYVRCYTGDFYNVTNPNSLTASQ